MRLESGQNQTKFSERLGLLRGELDKGQRHLELLDEQRHQVRDTLLRITGAIQVLEELLNASSSTLEVSSNWSRNHFQHSVVREGLNALVGAVLV